MLSIKKWTLREYDGDAADEIAEALSILPVTAKLLTERGCHDKKSALSFINKENAAMYDPFLLPDMKKAVLRIVEAEAKNEKVMVYGDYDVDGITGTSILVTFFRGLGLNVSYHIPERLTEGYGVNAEAVKSFKDKGISLVVTVDTGITAVDEVRLGKELGMDFIITDHHVCRPELPDAVAIVDPKREDCVYPFRDLAGVGVAFKLICAYNCYMATGETEYTKDDREIIFDALRETYKNYGDITALGTIADVMPVVDENRLIIAYGLNRMKKTKNKGLAALLKVTDLVSEENGAKKITSTNVGFVLAPRINAAGRLGSASKAVEMFLTESDEKAEELAAWLCEQNKERQKIELEIVSEAEEQIAKAGSIHDERMIVLSSDSWHHGVIGIVSSRITEKYNLPSILISFDGSENDGKGSGRSIAGFDLLSAITACSDRLIKFGGHTLAAGLSLKRSEYEAFKTEICEYAKERISDEMLVRETYYDAELAPDDVTHALVDDLSKLEPFGEGNPVPAFLMTGLKITEIIPLKEGKHVRVCFTKDGKNVVGMYFGMSAKSFPYLPTDTVDILFNVSENEFRGTVTTQIFIRDMRYGDEFISGYNDEINVYEYIKDDIILPQTEHIPERADCAELFKLIKKHTENDNAPFNLHKTLKTEIRGICYIKARLILDIFSELGLLEYKTDNGIDFDITLNKPAEKKQLTDSKLFSRLHTAV